MPSTTPRPRSVTLGCVYGGIGGALTTILVFETLSNWGSIELQEALTSAFAQVGADPDLDTVLPVLRWFVLAIMVAAIAATVFAVYAARGHLASRMGLTILAAGAGALSVFAGVAGIFPAVLAFLIVYLLWNAPARHWYAVVNGRTPLSLGAAPAVDPAPDPAPAATRPTAPGIDAPAPPPYDPAQHAPAAGRPRPVRLALIVALVGGVLGTGLSGLVLAAVVGLNSEVVRQYEESPLLRDQLDASGMSADQLVTLVTWLFAAWFAVSILLVIAVAWAATGRRSGWWALLVASVLAAGLGALGLPLGLVWILGAIVVVVQLTRPEARAWFQRT